MNLDDPKLTAYALGELDELTGEERLALEKLLAESAEARAFVEETAAFAQTLKGEFLTEMPATALRQVSRAELLSEVEVARKIAPFSAGRRVAWAVGLSAMAAALATVFYLPFEAKEAERSKARSRNERVSVLTEAGERKVEGNLVKAKAIDAAIGDNVVMNEPIDSETALALSSITTSAPSATLDSLVVTPPMELKSPAIPAAVPPPIVSVAGVSAPVLASKLTAAQIKEVAAFTGGWARREGASDFRGNGLGAIHEMERNVRERRASEAFNTEAYADLDENPFLAVGQNPLSTFSIDVDTASYSNVRRFLTAGQRPPVGAVRIEELLNYFRYDYAPPKGDAPFATHVEVAQCPWQPAHRLVRIGLKGRELREEGRASSNLVFLIDVSGSMNEPNKLPLLKQSMRLLVEKLGENDRVSMVVYAGAAGLVLPATRGDKKEAILAALERLQAGGSTNGAGGIGLAYETAVENMIPGGINRVILATDGDFNVGVTNESELARLIEAKAKTGVYLTVLGFGQGNYNDATMKKLSTKGNGNYAYIDSLREGRKVLVEQIGGTLVTIAKDVKIQVEFNPRVAGTYRLIGYENRLLRKEDFNDDKKDAGEIGAGHTVTALYEVVPVGVSAGTGKVDALKYQPAPAETVRGLETPASEELLTVKLRYKKPDGETSLLLEHPVTDRGAAIGESSKDFRFAAAVAEFGMLLKNSAHAGSATWESARELATEGKGIDEGGYRAEFIELLEKVKGFGLQDR